MLHLKIKSYTQFQYNHIFPWILSEPTNCFLQRTWAIRTRCPPLRSHTNRYPACIPEMFKSADAYVEHMIVKSKLLICVCISQLNVKAQ